MGVFATSVSHALGRIPQGSRLRLTVPWPVGSIDPHALDDGAAALFGSAIADPLYAIGPSGHPYPALADALPERAGSGVTVRLRPGMTTGGGHALGGEDVVFSLRRSGARSAVALLGSFGRPELSRGDRMKVFIPGATPEAAAQALSSPLTAIVPKGFVAHRPDGTGAFCVRQHRFGITLQRNERAARGPAFLQSIEVSTAASLAEALRAFETGDADVGWLGAGLHNPRPGASMFNAGRLGWVVLRTGDEALEWGAPGVAQTLADAVRPEQLRPYGLVPLPESGAPQLAGAPGETSASTITLGDNGKIFTYHVGDSFLLNLGGDVYDWTVSVDNQSVIALKVGVMVVKGAQGIYDVLAPGTAVLTAAGEPQCLKANPLCKIPSVLFRVTVVVG